MNSLLQTKNYLIGSDDAVDELAHKDSAVILAVSDCHGRSEMLKTIVEHFGPTADLFAYCGDGAEDVAHILEQVKKSKSLNKKFPSVAAIVQGNGDENLIPVNFNPTKSEKNNDFELYIPKMINAKVAGMNILITHGHMFGVYYGMAELEMQANLDKADLVLYGHTHIADRFDTETASYINPGSCALPRRGLPPSVAVIKVPGDQERITCTFYEIKASISEGITFIPFSPMLRHW